MYQGKKQLALAQEKNAYTQFQMPENMFHTSISIHIRQPSISRVGGY